MRRPERNRAIGFLGPGIRVFVLLLSTIDSFFSFLVHLLSYRDWHVENCKAGQAFRISDSYARAKLNLPYFLKVKLARHLCLMHQTPKQGPMGRQILIQTAFLPEHLLGARTFKNGHAAIACAGCNLKS